MVCLVVVSLGCGRLSFDPLASDTRADAANDSPSELPLNCSGRLICDGFESATLASSWSSQTVNGNLVVDSVRTHRGTRALHVHTDAGVIGDVRKAEILSSSQLPTNATPRILYARAWVYFPSPHANAYNQFITFSNTSGNGFSLGNRDLNVITNHFAGGDFFESATTQVPLDRWVCFKYEAPLNQTGTVRSFVDGNEVTDIADPLTMPEGTMTQLYLGLDWAGLSETIPAIDVWLDDIIVDDAPISCAD